MPQLLAASLWRLLIYRCLTVIHLLVHSSRMAVVLDNIFKIFLGMVACVNSTVIICWTCTVFMINCRFMLNCETVVLLSMHVAGFGC